MTVAKASELNCRGFLIPSVKALEVLSYKTNLLMVCIFKQSSSDENEPYQ